METSAFLYDNIFKHNYFLKYKNYRLKLILCDKKYIFGTTFTKRNVYNNSFKNRRVLIKSTNILLYKIRLISY